MDRTRGVAAQTDPAQGAQAVARPVDSRPAQTPNQTRSADLRLVIEQDATTGTYIYKSIDRRTGEVRVQLPREEVVRLRETPTYAQGALVKTSL